MDNLDCSGVYLICFDRPYKHARHYLGWAKNIGQRIKEHRNGTGGRLLAVINEAGIGVESRKSLEGCRPIS